jgi:DNA-binding CsgD family transcriptional regulator
LEIAESGTAVDDLARAHVHLLRAQIEFTSSRGSDAPQLLLAAARRLEPLDLDLARETYLDTLSAAMFAGRLATPGAGVLEVARAAMAAPQPLHPPRVPDLLLDGLATLFTDGYRPAVPILRRAQSAFGIDMSVAEQLRWLWLATVSSVVLWEDGRWETLSARHVQLARETGALGELPLALSQHAYVNLFAGELTAAASLVEQIHAATEATGSNLAPYAAVGLAALRGREAEAAPLIDGSRGDVTQRGEGIGLSVLDWAEAALYNGLGRYEEACGAALRVTEYRRDLNSSNWWMVELIEAAVRSGTPELAAETHRRLQEMTQASGTDWALGLEARSRALLSNGTVAEDLYREALMRLARTWLGSDLARAHLLYGEWLRRERRRLDAREQLRTAYELFRDFGMEGFAERARLELEATGEHARQRTADTLDQLTPQETQIARLAAEGHTNREIAVRLFISASTVEYHLRKAFRKLGVKSRTQLEDRLSKSGRP